MKRSRLQSTGHQVHRWWLSPNVLRADRRWAPVHEVVASTPRSCSWLGTIISSTCTTEKRQPMVER